MPTISEIARDWGCDRSYVSRKVKSGCPTDSLENARLWRKAHASKRAPTNPKQIAHVVSGEKDDDSKEARDRRKQYYETHPNSRSLPSQDPLEEALLDARDSRREAYRLLSDALVDEADDKLAVRIAAHTKALEALLEAERQYQAILESRRILIPLDEAQDIARRGYDVLISRLSALPQNMCARVNPSNPHHAMELLQSECTGILADAKKAIAAA